jgi:RNA polymerase sigma-70 factor (ECF subfamily)
VLPKKLTQEELQQELKLIEMAQRQPERFGVLYDRYYRQIFLFVYKRTGEEELAADLVSQVFLKALMNLPKYQYKGVPFSAWLYRIASNEVSQHFRDKKGDRVVSIETKSAVKALRDLSENMDDGEAEKLIRTMMETIREMDPEDVQIIELRFFEGRPFLEVGYILGITENNAKVRVYRILERVKKKMEKKLAGQA